MAFVEGLKGMAANERGEVTLAGLTRYVQETVSENVRVALGEEQKLWVEVSGFDADKLVIARVSTQLSPRHSPD